MIKHLKIFARGIIATWFAWAFMAYAIAVTLIGGTFGIALFLLPIIGFLLWLIYMIGKYEKDKEAK